MRYLLHSARASSNAAAFALLFGSVLGASGCDDPVRSAPAPAAVEVAAGRSFLDVGDTLGLAVTIRDAQGNALSGREVAWTSSDTLVSTVAAGVVRGRAPGRATITAAVGQVTGTLDLTVEPRVDSILMAYDNRTTLLPGVSAQLRVVSLLSVANGKRETVRHSTSWSSSNPAVVAVSDSGVVRGVAPGTATVTVAAGSASKQVPVAVIRPYTVTPLETMEGATTLAYDLNEAGEVVGTATFSWDSSRAVVWRSGRMTVLGSGAAYAINDRGQVAGSSGGPAGGGAAVVWEGGAMREVYRGGTRARATAINRHGDVAGVWEEPCSCRYYDAGAFAVIGGRVVDVVPRDPYRSPAVYGINDAGWVVGSTGNNRSAPDAFLYRNGELVNLESTVFGTSSTTYSEAAGVNNRGQVVGYGPSSEGWYQGLPRGYVLEDGKTRWLGPADPPPSGARAINDRGEVVGQVGGIGRPGPGALTHGFLWSAGGAARLDWLVAGDEWIIRVGVAINERGQILAHGRNARTGAEVPLLLTPPD